MRFGGAMLGELAAELVDQPRQQLSATAPITLELHAEATVRT
jgi:hypothetical protein